MNPTDDPTWAARPPVDAGRRLMVVIWLLVALLALALGGIFYVAAHAPLIRIELPRKTTAALPKLSTTTAAAGECHLIAYTHRSAVPVRRGPLAPKALINPLAGALSSGAGFLSLTGKSNTADLSAHAAGQRTISVNAPRHV